MAYHPSTCPFCSCGCALLLHEEGGRLLGSYPRVGPGGRASLCIRGWNCTGSLAHPDRLTAPMIRGAGGLVGVADEEAIQEAARRLRDAAAPPLFAVGPSLSNEDAMAIRRLAGLLGSRVCTTDMSGAPAGRIALRRVLGRGYGMDDLEAIAAADLVWLFGEETADFPQAASRVVAARRAGAAIVRFDVHATGGRDGSRAVKVSPDRLGALAVSLQRAVFQGRLVSLDAGQADGLATLAAVRGAAPPVPADEALADEDALALVREFRAARNPVAIIGSRWLTSARAVEDTSLLLQLLALLGAAGRVVAAVGEVNSWGCLDILGPDLPPAEIACREDTYDTLVVAGDDPIGRSPRPDALAERLGRLRTVVAIDRFASQTSALADIVLPSTAFAEQDGTVTNAFGSVQRWCQAVSPPGRCRPERAWAARIGRALGASGWPDTARSWFQAVGTERGEYRAIAADALYRDPVPGWAPPNRPAAPRIGAATHLSLAPVESDDAHRWAPPESGFPLLLVLGSHPASWSTGAFTGRDDVLRREARESSLAASPALLEAIGLKPGWPARLLVPGGEATVRVRGDARLPRHVCLLAPVAGSPEALLRGFYPGAGRQTLGVQPVPARLERA